MSLLSKPKSPGCKPKLQPSSPAFKRRRNDNVIFLSCRGKGNGKKKNELEKQSQSNPSSPKGIFRRMFQEKPDKVQRKVDMPAPPPLQPTAILISPTDEVENTLHSKPTQSEPPKSPSQSQLAVQGTPKSRSSVVSVESGYDTDGSRSNLLNEGKSTSDLLDSGASTQGNCQSSSKPKPKSLKDMHDKHPIQMFHVRQRSSMCSLPENMSICPLDAENRQPISEDSSPTDSETSSVYTTEQLPPRHRRRSLTRTPSDKIKKLSLSDGTATKIYKDIPKKYAKYRRTLSEIFQVMIANRASCTATKILLNLHRMEQSHTANIVILIHCTNIMVKPNIPL